MVSNKRISLDPSAPDNLYTGALKINAALDEFTQQLSEAAVNVKSFGAKGDGVTDDTLAIKSAVAHAYSIGVSTIYFPSVDNYYLISSAIKPKSNMRFKGDSDKPFIKNTSNLAFNLFNVDGVENVSFKNLSFQNGVSSEGNSLGGKDGLRITNSKNVSIRECFFTEMGGHNAVSVYKTDGLYVDDSVFYKCTYTMLSLGMEVENVHIQRCKFDTVTSLTMPNTYTISTGSDNYTAPHKFLVRNIHITKCELLNNPRWEGIDSHGGKGLYIEDNYIENVLNGIMVRFDNRPQVPFEQSDIYIRNNIIIKGDTSASGQGGIIVGGDSNGSLAFVDNVHVVGNKVIGNFGSIASDNTGGIYVSTTRNFYVKDNTVEGCVNKAIVFFASCYGEVSGNKFLNTLPSSYGTIRPVRFLNACYHVVFKENVIRNSAPLDRVGIGVFNNAKGLVEYKSNLIEADTPYLVSNAMMNGIVSPTEKIGISGTCAKNQHGIITHYCTNNKLRSVDAEVSNLTITGNVGEKEVTTNILALTGIGIGEEIVIVGAGEGGSNLTTTFSEFINKDRIAISNPILTAVTNAKVRTLDSTWVAVTA